MLRKILIVEDIETNRMILRQILSRDYDVLEAESGRQALSILQTEHEGISAVLLDIVMPEMDGYDVLREMKQDDRLEKIPVIVATANTDIGAELKALSLGAIDFITKPYKPALILQRTQNVISLRESAAEVNAAKRDRLTGLYNREAFFDKAAEMIAANEAGYYVLSCFDIDNFKVINDQYGNKQGDRVLRFIADTVGDGFTAAGGICCRIAADDYAVLYPQSFMRSGEADAIMQRAAALGGGVQPVTISTGRYIVDDLSLPVSAMYDRAILAKETIKGRFDAHVAQYDESMRQHLLKEQEIVNDMGAALLEQQYEVWLQPQYNHSTGALIGAEALVRWRHPQKGLISPGVFIPVFERNGFIYELDKYVWEHTCMLLRKWLDEGRSPLPVSVNISRNDVFRDDLIDVITGLLKRYRLPVDLLRLEITETAFAESAGQIIRVVKQLIEHGFTIEIDDFGSGYSSLNTLKDVPAQILKLDMRFLENSDNSGRGGNIVESVVRMAKWLGMAVIAEGVETQEQADYLRSIGCNYLQGYYYAKPMPASEYEALAKEIKKEEKLLVLETVENLNNNAFWNPQSMDTLIFNSYVGGACIFEYHKGRVELLRANEKYAQMLGGAGMTVERALKLDWVSYFDEESRAALELAVTQSANTKDEVTTEYVLHGLPGCPEQTYLRVTQRVIAAVGERYLLYCVNENITAQREAEKKRQEAEEKEQAAAEQLKIIMENINGGVTAVTIIDGEPHFLLANEQFYTQHGYTKAQYQAEVKSAYELIHPDERARLVEMTRVASEKGEPFSCTFRKLKRDGSVIWMQSSISIIHLPGIEEPVQLAIGNDVTAQREAERREMELAQRMQAIMDHVSSGITAVVAKEEEVRFIFANDRYFEMLGYTREQLFAEVKSIYQLIHPEDRPRVAKAVEEANATGGTKVLEYRVFRRDGVMRWHRILITMARFDDVDEPVQLGISTDITKEHETAEQISALNENLMSLMNEAPGGYVRMRVRADGTGVPDYVNENFCTLLGMTQTEVMDIYRKDVMAEVHPDDVQIVTAAIRAAFETNGRTGAKYRVRHKNGDYIWLQMFGRLTHSQNGEYFLNTYYADLSEQEKREISFRETMPLLLNAIMESTTDTAYAKDRELRYICCSPAFLAMGGFSSEAEIIGKNDFELFPYVVAEQFRQFDLKLFATGQSIIDQEDRIPHGDGSIHYYETSKYLLRDELGNAVGVYGVSRDVTAYRKSYAQLKLLTDSIPGGIATYACTPEGVFNRFFNDGFCELMGCTREEYEEISKNGCLQTVYAEDLPLIMEQIDTLKARGTPINCTFRIRSMRDDSIKWVNLRGILFERYGDAYIVNAALYDVTEEKLAEDNMRRAQQEILRTKRLVDDSSSAVYVCDVNNCELLYINQKCADMCNKTVEEGLGQPCYHYLKGLAARCEDCYIDTSNDVAYTEREYTSPATGRHYMSRGKIIRWGERRAFVDYLSDETESIDTRLNLQASQRAMEMASLSNGVSFWRYDIDNKTLKWGEYKHTSYLGYPDEIENMPDAMLDAGYIHPEDEAAFRQMYQELFDGAETCECTVRMRNLKTGKFIWHHTVYTRLHDSYYKTRQAIGFAESVELQQEIKAKYEHELQLRHEMIKDSEKYFEVNLSTGEMEEYRSKDGEPQVTTVSGSGGAAFHNELLRHVAEDDHAALENTLFIDSLLRRYRNGEDSVSMEYRRICPNGGLRWVRGTATVMTRPNTSDVIAFIDVQDIDEEKKDHFALDSVIDEEVESIVLVNVKSGKARVVKSKHDMIISKQRTEFSHEAHIDSLIDTIILPEDKERFREFFRLARLTQALEHAPSTEITFQTQEAGEVKRKRTIARYLDDSKNDIVLSRRDITKLYMEEQRHREVLQNAVNAANEANRAKSEFLSRMSHDMRTPMNAIIGLVNLAKEQNRTAEMEEYLESIDASSHFLLGLINDVLDLSRIESGRIELHEEPYTLAEFERAIRTVIQPLMDERGITFVMDMDSNVSCLMIDKLRCNQIFFNLLSNAAKYTQKGGRVELLSQRLPEKDGKLGIRHIVRDNGCGMSEAFLRIAFEPFSQESSETTSELQGSGLGLAIVKNLVNAMGGSIQVKSKVGEGTEFTVDLYAYEAAAQSAEGGAEALDLSPLNGLRVLLVEDNAMNIVVAKKMVAHAGCMTDVANNGQEAVERFSRSAPGEYSAIFMDVRMPVMDGLEATRRIRALERPDAATIPIIAMTADAFLDDKNKTRAAGMNAHVTKPVEPQVMFQTMLRLIKH